MDILAFEIEYDAFDTGGEPHPRGSFTSKLLDKPVITTAAADSALPAFYQRLDFEHGSGVVIQPAYQVMVDIIGQLQVLQGLFKLLKVYPAFRTEIVYAVGCPGGQHLTIRFLAIQKP